MRFSGAAIERYVSSTVRHPMSSSRNDKPTPTPFRLNMVAALNEGQRLARIYPSNSRIWLARCSFPTPLIRMSAPSAPKAICLSDASQCPGKCVCWPQMCLLASNSVVLNKLSSIPRTRARPTHQHPCSYPTVTRTHPAVPMSRSTAGGAHPKKP
jgi:hypothetical protein